MVENQEKNIENKVAIVTGGAKGIGASIVKKLAQNGYIVILNYNKSINEAKAIENEFNNVYTFKADVSNYEEVKSLVDFTINKFGKIDLLVNNAGIDLVKTINDTSIEDFDNILKTNLYSAFYTSKEVSRYMINAKRGKIINISSIWGIIGASCEMAYSVSKAGIDAMTKSKYTAKEYMESKNILTKEEITKIIEKYDEINKLGIPFTVVHILTSSLLGILIYAIISII